LRTSRSLIVLPSRARWPRPMEWPCRKHARTRGARVPALRRWKGWSWCGRAFRSPRYFASPVTTFVAQLMTHPNFVSRAPERPSGNEGHLVDLAQRGQAREDLLQGAVAQEGHALLARHLLDLARGPALQDELADAVRH